MLPEDPNNEWFRYLAYTALAAIGGGLGYIMRTLEARRKINWWTVLLQAAAAAFVGLLTLLLCMAMGFSMLWIGAIVGLLGWLGANASIGVISTVVFNKLGISPKQEPVREREDDAK